MKTFGTTRSWLRCTRRSGATLLETSVLIPVFLAAVFGMLDLSLYIVRQQSLAEAARVAARTIIVRGSYADVLGSLGPHDIYTTAASDNTVARAIRPHLLLMEPKNVRLYVDWHEHNNTAGSHVHVILTSSCTPITTYLFGHPTWELSARATMTIAH